MGNPAEVIDRPLDAASGEESGARPLGGRVALVTGAGRGLGEAIAEALAAAGATVVVADVRAEAAGEVASRLGLSGASASALALDVSDEEQARAAVERVEREYGVLDVLVNNAGIDVTLPVVELSVQEWDRVLAVNLRGPLLMSKFALARMQPRGHGHIVSGWSECNQFESPARMLVDSRGRFYELVGALQFAATPDLQNHMIIIANSKNVRAKRAQEFG